MSEQNGFTLNGETVETAASEEKYESTPETLTGFKKSAPPWFDRKKVMMTISVGFAVVVIAGVIFSSTKKKETVPAEENAGFAAQVPRDFLRQEYERSLREQVATAASGEEALVPTDEEVPPADEEGLPKVVPVTLAENPSAPQPRQSVPQASQRSAPAPASPQTNQPPPVPYTSPLVPRIEGSLFAASLSYQGAPVNETPAQFDTSIAQGAMPGTMQGGTPRPSYTGYQTATQDLYTTQNNQENKNEFYNSQAGGAAGEGSFLSTDLLWTGTIIPAVLETAINTDLPGNVIARVTQNIYDSQTGKNLLVPQGTLLVAKYNSSVSYAQKRVQIVWDALIRPDGFYLELESMNGVDAKGMAGLPAQYHENWFEYIKAAGIITMFSLANSKMAEEAEKYTNENIAGGIAQANAQFIGEIGNSVVSRAMAIQPTLTVEAGEKINVMLNKSVHLPPAKNIPVTQKYRIE